MLVRNPNDYQRVNWSPWRVKPGLLASQALCYHVEALATAMLTRDLSCAKSFAKHLTHSYTLNIFAISPRPVKQLVSERYRISSQGSLTPKSWFFSLHCSFFPNGQEANRHRYGGTSVLEDWTLYHMFTSQPGGEERATVSLLELPKLHSPSLSSWTKAGKQQAPTEEILS